MLMAVAWREPEDPLTPMMIAEKRERIEQVREAVLGLPAEFREAVVLCELEEMSYEEAAKPVAVRWAPFVRVCIAVERCCWRSWNCCEMFRGGRAPEQVVQECKEGS